MCDIRAALIYSDYWTITYQMAVDHEFISFCIIQTTPYNVSNAVVDGLFSR